MAFKLIAITPELTLPDETWRITHLLDAGFDAVHLRKPHCGEEEMRRYVDTLPRGIADRLAMHYFPDVAAEKGIGGVHLNKRSPRVPEGWKGAVSRSCHSLEEVAESRELDYVFLSPVFDSISKQGYASHFSEEQLRTRRREGDGARRRDRRQNPVARRCGFRRMRLPGVSVRRRRRGVLPPRGAYCRTT